MPLEAQTITLGATTTTENSGLLGEILPQFAVATGLNVQVVVQGSGAILKLGETGDLDLLLVHDRIGEDRFMEAGWGELRRDVMASRFVIVGSAEDPARIRGLGDPVSALRQIAETGNFFISRGDESGTHAAELRLWEGAGLAPQIDQPSWYRQSGAGMGATLNIVAGLGAYALTDIATWLGFGNRAGLEIMVGGTDPRLAEPGLANPYGIILVNSVRHPHLDTDAARRFIDWLTGPEGRAAIAGFVVSGEHPFVPTGGGE